MEARVPTAMEHLYVWPGGHDAWLDLRIYPAGDGIAMFYRDITERRRDEEALRQSEQRLRDLNADLELQVLERARERGRTWQVSPDLLSVINADGMLESTNPAWNNVLGWAASELASRPFSDFVHPEDRDRTNLVWAEAMAGQPILRFEHRYRTRNGDYRWLSWVAVPEGGKVYCSARDITGERQQADELAMAQEALRQSQKMEAVGQLTGGLAHDFNNLLTGILGSLERLQTRISQGRIDDLDRYVNAAQGAARRASALTHRLLAFSRRQTLDPKPTDINRLVAGMEELIKRTMGPEISIQPDMGAAVWTILVDPGQLENALLNLCINARDAMPGGGTLRIITDNSRLDERAAKEREMRAGRVRLTLRQRHRRRHDARDHHSGFRPFLHHQAHRPGDRAWLVDGLRLRPPVGRPGAHKLRGASGGNGVPLSAPASGRGRGGRREGGRTWRGAARRTGGDGAGRR